mmetsp:Transcript_29466/g.76045  ORF Transcript_29466/g.76045 Transcript_29466/m.76045 type:complete len:248 (+) Transcript_29466:1848-2591(+)
MASPSLPCPPCFTVSSTQIPNNLSLYHTPNPTRLNSSHARVYASFVTPVPVPSSPSNVKSRASSFEAEARRVLQRSGKNSLPRRSAADKWRRRLKSDEGEPIPPIPLSSALIAPNGSRILEIFALRRPLASSMVEASSTIHSTFRASDGRREWKNVHRISRGRTNGVHLLTNTHHDGRAPAARTMGSWRMWRALFVSLTEDERYKDCTLLSSSLCFRLCFPACNSPSPQCFPTFSTLPISVLSDRSF